ncbi:MAG: D-alanyl-D-alanine carboxypeptidase family protein [Fimbriimonas sp.]
MNGFTKTLAIPLFLLPAFAAAMDIKAKSAIIMDATTGKVLWSKDADTPRFPASTTKIMTGMLLLEHTQPEDVIIAPKDVDKVGESSMHLKPGEKVTARDMLYALMLRSANDGCYAVARHIAGSVPEFSRMMNERAKQIGCTNTHFNNPNGLNDPIHTTTARDLALIAREAMKNPLFEEVVRTPKFQIQRSINQKDLHMVSRNKWLRKDATADGIKTGYTRPAGHCYVGSATRDGYRVITVVLKSENWQKDHQQMLDWAFKNHERYTLVGRDGEVAQVPIANGAKGTLTLGAVTPVETILRRSTIARVGGHKAVEPMIDATLQAPIAKGQVVCKATVRDAEGFEQQVDLVALEDVGTPPLVAQVGSPNGLYAFGGTVVACTWVARSRSRRRKYGRQTTARIF